MCVHGRISNKSIYKLLAHPEPITSIDISADSTLITSSSYDCYVRLWDMMKGQCSKTMMADAGIIRLAAMVEQAYSWAQTWPGGSSSE